MNHEARFFRKIPATPLQASFLGNPTFNNIAKVPAQTEWELRASSIRKGGNCLSNQIKEENVIFENYTAGALSFTL